MKVSDQSQESINRDHLKENFRASKLFLLPGWTGYASFVLDQREYDAEHESSKRMS